MRVVGVAAAFNERRVLRAFLEHHRAQGVEIHLIDNGSTDETAAIAAEYLGRGVCGLESLPREAEFDLVRVLRRKEALAAELDADWVIHLDPDEWRESPWPGLTLAEALRRVADAGYNAVNFIEFTFVPTREDPDHDHPRFPDTMRWYYPFLPRLLHRVNGWRRAAGPVDLCRTGGHQVIFPGRMVYPVCFPMRHYQYLSVAHAVDKYANRRHARRSLDRGFHGWRDRLDPATIRLPGRADLSEARPGDPLDLSRPRSRHLLDPGEAPPLRRSWFCRLAERLGAGHRSPG